MKKILLLLMPLTLTFLFTGCITSQVQFQESYVANESVAYITNKKDLKVSIKKFDSYQISKKPNTIFMGQANTLIIDNNFIEKDLKAVLEQYVSSVDISAINNSDIFIEAKLLDFNWAPEMGAISGGQSSEFYLNIKVFYKNKEILNKNYREYYNRTSFYFSLLSGKELTNYVKSKDLFIMYNEKFIPDLAKALKENM